MIFYGVHIKDPELSFLFDAMRFIVQPDALRRSHITVRGPYERRIDITRFRQHELGDLGIIRPGNFLLNRQNTVFLHCDLVGIRDIWKKPDFGQGVVHLTIYDGDNRSEASKIFTILMEYNWNIWTKPTNLIELDKKVVNTEAINILEPAFSRRLVNLLKEDFDISKLRRIEFSRRFKMFRFVLETLRKRYMFPHANRGR